LRAVVEIAERNSSVPVPIRDFARAQGISTKYAKQLMNHLGKAGIVRGYRGVGGGYALARDPYDITVFDIYDALKEDVHLAPCVGAGLDCEREDSCAARSFWNGMSRVLVRELRSTTIGDLLENKKASPRR
jgi:Rrf2 family iron-sulfur cluster assembly transcriptional regulator